MNLTTSIRERVRTWMPLEDLLPDHLPAFVRSPAYFFGVITLSSLVLLFVSGIVLAAFGPQWWHDSPVGHFVNSVHFWCAEAFFFSLTLHLWTEFCKAAWRHGRRLTWVVGAITFVAAIGTAFTGYLSQTNFDAQWIAVQGKDALQRCRYRRVLQPDELWADVRLSRLPASDPAGAAGGPAHAPGAYPWGGTPLCLHQKG